MNKATQPHQTIYITAFMNETESDGDIVTYLALDEFSDSLFPPLVAPSATSDNQLIETLINFYNGIKKSYNPKIHAKQTTYVVNLPTSIHSIFQGMIMQNDTFVYDPEKVKKVFEPVFRAMA